MTCSQATKTTPVLKVPLATDVALKARLCTPAEPDARAMVTGIMKRCETSDRKSFSFLLHRTVPTRVAFESTELPLWCPQKCHDFGRKDSCHLLVKWLSANHATIHTDVSSFQEVRHYSCSSSHGLEPILLAVPRNRLAAVLQKVCTDGSLECLLRSLALWDTLGSLAFINVTKPRDLWSASWLDMCGQILQSPWEAVGLETGGYICIHLPTWHFARPVEIPSHSNFEHVLWPWTLPLDDWSPTSLDHASTKHRPPCRYASLLRTILDL